MGKKEKNKKEDKEKKTRGPSMRMLSVFRKVLESKGKVSISKAMRDVGYPATTAKNPQQLTCAKSWQKMLQEAFPDDMVLKYHGVLANAFKLDHSVFPLAIKDEDIVRLLDSTNCTVIKIQYGVQAKHVYFWAPDNMTRDKALEKIYKLKGKYAPQKISIVDPNANKTDEELYEEQRKINKEIADLEAKEKKQRDKAKSQAKKGTKSS